MPYISKELQRKFSIPHNGRDNLDQEIRDFADHVRTTYASDEHEGVLNYCITRLITIVLGELGWRYFKINRAVGVLECVKQEFYRRLAAPYEDSAIAKNGDIPEYNRYTRH